MLMTHGRADDVDCMFKYSHMYAVPNIDNMFSLFKPRTEPLVYHEASGDMLLYDFKANALHIWNPVSGESWMVKAEVNYSQKLFATVRIGTCF